MVQKLMLFQQKGRHHYTLHACRIQKRTKVTKTSITSILLKYGANANAPDDNSKTLLHHSSLLGNMLPMLKTKAVLFFTSHVDCTLTTYGQFRSSVFSKNNSCRHRLDDDDAR